MKITASKNKPKQNPPRGEWFDRSDWGSRLTDRERLNPNLVKGLALHWPGADRRWSTVESVMESLRGYQRDHMDNNGWDDIAYQRAIDQAGNSYQLRGLQNRSAANGDTDVNTEYGAVLLMLGIGEKPSRRMIAAIRNTVTVHRSLFPNSTKVVGHSQIRPEPTACPGGEVMILVNRGAFG